MPKKSALKKELDAFAALISVLKPLTNEQRTRLIASAKALLEDGPSDAPPPEL